TAQ
ncbi:hypothetical protein CLOP_g12552, partial [Closterium sp. NIES-67]